MRVNIEQLNALFQSADLEQRALSIVGEKVFRVEIGGERHYKRENGLLYRSLTTFLSRVMPENKFLNTWRENMAAELGTREQVAAYVETLADYGSALHIAVANFCRDGMVDWLEFEHWAADFLQESGFEKGTLQMAVTELTRDFAGIIQFLHDYEARVVAVEIPVWMDAGVATLIDLVVEMNEKNYADTPAEKRRRQLAIINLKSGKKSTFESHLLQLVGERRMWNERYLAAGFPISAVYNLRPNDWKTTPTYTLKAAEKPIIDGRLEEQFDAFLTLAKLRGDLEAPTRRYQVFMGVTQYGASPAEQIVQMGHNELFNFKRDKDNEN